MKYYALFSLLLATALAIIGWRNETEDSISEILTRYTEDYQHDPNVVDVTFAIVVDEMWWHVAAIAGTESETASVRLLEGPPPEPTLYFTMDSQTLRNLDTGVWNAKTAMAKEHKSDPIPMDIEIMDGFHPTESLVADVLSLTFHFWTRGLPEIVPFGEDHTRFTHGADAAVFYYQPGFRSLWISLKPGQHANEKEESQTNPFPSLLIITEGRGKGKVGGQPVELTKGNAVFIPKETPHEFWNDLDSPMEGILLMFGEGA